MIRRKILACILLGLLAGCKREASHMPPGRMAPIIADLHVADAWSTLVRDTVHPHSDKNYDSLAKWTTQIFAKHGVTRMEFEKSMDWYRDHPAELDTMYAHIIPMLEKQRRFSN
jgi:hypothetical protein